MARFKVTYPTNGLEAGAIVESEVCPQWLKGKCLWLPDEPVRKLEVATPKSRTKKASA